MKRKIAIVGAGPAGTSLAIRLAQMNFDITLIERERFPRQKLCGEFISPECFAHFESLGVLETMMSAGGDRIYETSFYSPNGRSVTIPTKWLAGQSALSLSRAEMDLRLIRRARNTGVKVLEGTSVVANLHDGAQFTGVRVRTRTGDAFSIDAHITVDATGRSAALSRTLSKSEKLTAKKPGLIGFKTHMRGTKVEPGRCEIYVFKGGYAGLSNIGSGFANLCFLVEAGLVRVNKSDVAKIIENVLFQNVRASAALASAETTGPWLAVSIGRFGSNEPCPSPGLFAVGDSAAFIDPFTGSGMLMAFESSELLANAIARHPQSISAVAKEYSNEYGKRFGRRLSTASMLRRLAFIPALSSLAISAAGASTRLAESITRLTRH